MSKYKIVECKSLLTGKVFWQVNQEGVLDPLSQHEAKSAAVHAVKCYETADRRRAA